MGRERAGCSTHTDIAVAETIQGKDVTVVPAVGRNDGLGRRRCIKGRFYSHGRVSAGGDGAG